MPTQHYLEGKTCLVRENFILLGSPSDLVGIKFGSCITNSRLEEPTDMGRNPPFRCFSHGAEVVERRKLPVFEEFFVNTALVLALRECQTGRKQQEPKERNLTFSKLFSDPKNIKYQEN